MPVCAVEGVLEGCGRANRPFQDTAGRVTIVSTWLLLRGFSRQACVARPPIALRMLSGSNQSVPLHCSSVLPPAMPAASPLPGRDIGLGLQRCGFATGRYVGELALLRRMVGRRGRSTHGAALAKRVDTTS